MGVATDWYDKGSRKYSLKMVHFDNLENYEVDPLHTCLAR
jgi:hypothetical protein